MGVSKGTLRRIESQNGIPTVAPEMGRGHRFQTTHLDRALHCVASVLAEDEVLPNRPVTWPGWTRVVASDGERSWLRAETGGLVVGVLENAIAYPGHRLCHFVSLDESTADSTRSDIVRGASDVYRQGGFQWPDDP